MMAKLKNIGKAVLLVLFALVLLIGCGDDEDGVTYSISTTNLTNNQPLSPMAVVVHRDGYLGWNEGRQASLGLEVLAESGNPDSFLTEANGSADVVLVEKGNGLIFPGTSDTVTVLVGHSSKLRLTTASMLGNTNDGFTGVNGVLIGDLMAGESRTFFTLPFDAGTEKNVETAETVPGPAGGGEGYNTQRDDRDFVAIHGGTVTSDDGLPTSTLDESHRFIGPVAKVVVTRIN